MNREEEGFAQVDLGQSGNDAQAQAQEAIPINIQEQETERVEDPAQRVQQEMRHSIEKLGFKGDKVNVYQQNALMVLEIQLVVSTFLAMFVAQISFLGDVWTFIPGVEIFMILLYLSCMLYIQFMQGSASNVMYTFIAAQSTWNYTLSVVSSVAKVFVISYFHLWFYDIRVEVILVTLASIVAYILSQIYLPTQRNQAVDISIGTQLKWLSVYLFGITVFLAFFTRASGKVWVFIFLYSMGYATYLLLCLKRFSQHTYFEHDSNDLYLGALQIDADMFLPCQLFTFLFGSQKPASTAPSNRSSLHANQNQQDQDGKVEVQSQGSVAEKLQTKEKPDSVKGEKQDEHKDEKKSEQKDEQKEAGKE